MSEPIRHLRSVDTETGEVHETCPNCEALGAQLAGLEKEVRAWRTRYHNLKQRKDDEMGDHELFPAAKRLFDVWRHVCRHANARFTPDRFAIVEPYLRSHGEVRCCRAICGAAHEPFTKIRKNGSEKRFDDWDLIFRNASKLEDFEARAPARFTDEYITAQLEPGQGALDE